VCPTIHKAERHARRMSVTKEHWRKDVTNQNSFIEGVTQLPLRVKGHDVILPIFYRDGGAMSAMFPGCRRRFGGSFTVDDALAAIETAR